MCWFINPWFNTCFKLCTLRLVLIIQWDRWWNQKSSHEHNAVYTVCALFTVLQIIVPGIIFVLINNLAVQWQVPSLIFKWPGWYINFSTWFMKTLLQAGLSFISQIRSWKSHVNRTQNSHLKQCIFLGDWQPHPIQCND